MRRVEHRAQHIADAVARPHRHARRERGHRQPRTHLAVEPGLDVRRVRLHPREALRQQREAPERLRVPVSVRLAGTDSFDAMVHGAHTGREEQPFRRMHRRRRVEDHGARNGVRMVEQLLQLHALVRDARNGAELAGRERGRDGDLRDRRPGRRVAQRVHLLRRADVVGEAHAHRLRAVGQRAAAEGDDQVGIGRAGGLGRVDHIAAGRVRPHAVELPGDLVAERAAELFDLSGLAVERAAHHEEDALGAQPLRLLGHRLFQRRAEAHRLHPPERHPARFHCMPSPPCRVRAYGDRIPRQSCARSRRPPPMPERPHAASARAMPAAAARTMFHDCQGPE